MQNKNQTQVDKDLSKKQIYVTRQFDAPVDRVWEAWTKPEILDEWWAPNPWKAETKSMDFREGGVWIYAMVGPDGTKQWCQVDYKNITPNKSFSGYDAFCDDQGNIIENMPRMFWELTFVPVATGTRVDVVMTFETEEELNKILEMGFAEGFTAAHGNLDQLLATK